LETSSTPAKQPATRWGAERRIEFIDFRLMWEGTVNRSELVQFFGISIQQASADLARYIEVAPENIEYDKNLKTYRVRPSFKPALIPSDAHAYLNQLAGLATGTIAPSASFLGWVPPHDLVRYPTRPISAETLVQLMWAIRDRKELHIQYQSMRRPAASMRWVAPHAIAFDGFRWHVRAWCHEREAFLDFVFSRIQKVLDVRSTTKDSNDDSWWHTNIEVVIRPREGLTPEQRRGIELDFGMEAGLLKLNCRKAMAFYLLRQLQLDKETTETPAAQPLEVANRESLVDVLAAAQKVPSSTPSVPPHLKGALL
jgi:hypothetical protein